jgi:hypothetical protein
LEVVCQDLTVVLEILTVQGSGFCETALRGGRAQEGWLADLECREQIRKAFLFVIRRGLAVKEGVRSLERIEAKMCGVDTHLVGSGSQFRQGGSRAPGHHQ